MPSKVFWTGEERLQVLTKAAEVFHRGGVSHFEALRTAQNLTLPTHRLRTMATHSAVTPEVKLLKEMLASNPIIKKVETPRPSLQTQPEPPVAQPAGLANATMEDLIAEIAKRIAGKLTMAIDHEIKELEHTFKLQKHNPTYATSGIFKKRVVIIGLLKDQEHAIKQEFEDKFSIKCINADDAKHADVVDAQAYLIMKNFVSHAASEKYQKLPQHVLIDGGMSTLRMWFNTKGAEL